MRADRFRFDLLSRIIEITKNAVYVHFYVGRTLKYTAAYHVPGATIIVSSLLRNTFARIREEAKNFN